MQVIQSRKWQILNQQLKQTEEFKDKPQLIGLEKADIETRLKKLTF